MLNASNPLKCRLLRYNKRGKKRMTKCQSKMDSNAVSGTQPLLLDYIKDQFLPLNRRSWSTQAGDHLIWFISTLFVLSLSSMSQCQFMRGKAPLAMLSYILESFVGYSDACLCLVLGHFYLFTFFSFFFFHFYPPLFLHLGQERASPTPPPRSPSSGEWGLVTSAKGQLYLRERQLFSTDAW